MNLPLRGKQNAGVSPGRQASKPSRASQKAQLMKPLRCCNGAGTAGAEGRAARLGTGKLGVRLGRGAAGGRFPPAAAFEEGPEVRRGSCTPRGSRSRPLSEESTTAERIGRG